jgi:hypothetical protein
MKFFKNKKIILTILALSVVVWVITAEIAQAEGGGLLGFLGIDRIAAKGVGWAAAAVGYIFGFITSFVFWLGGLLVTWALNINSQLLSGSNAIVHTGWQIVLNFANLGFVLAIIIIAFATIFRLQGYQMKQILWKLIVAALLVNFSLVIAGTFINVSDIFSRWLLAKATLEGPGTFSIALANALGVQSFLNTSKPADEIDAIIKGLNNFGAHLLTFIASVFFVALFTLLGAITLLAIAVMLIIRYVALGILLILSPIVWLFWIFPGTAKYWQQWWEKFFRWTFFSPIVLFFLYLVVQTSVQIEKYAKQFNIVMPELEAEGFTFGVDSILNLVIMLGLMFGGLMAANSLSITGAKTFYGAAQGTGKWFGGAVKGAGRRAGLGAASRVTGGEKMKNLTEKLATSKVPGAKLVARGLNRLGAKTEQATQKSYEDEAKLYSGPRLETAILTSRGARRAAFVNKATKERDISGKVKERLFADGETMEKIENELKRSGYKPGDIAKTIGYNSKMLKAETKEALDKAAKELYGTFNQENWNKISPSALLDEKFGEIITENLLDRSAGSLSKILPKVKKSEDLKKITKKVKEKMEEIIKKAATEEEIDFAAKLEKSIKKSLAKRYFEAEEEKTEEKES